MGISLKPPAMDDNLKFDIVPVLRCSRFSSPAENFERIKSQSHEATITQE